MGAWLAKHLRELGAQVELRPLGKQVLDGQEIDLPPAVLGSLGNDPNKVCDLPCHRSVSHSRRRKPCCFTDTTMSSPLLKRTAGDSTRSS